MLTSYWLPDDRTIVLSSPAAIARTFSLRGPVNQPGWAEKWKYVADSPAVVMVKADLLQPIVARLDPNQPAPNLSDDADYLLLKGRQVAGKFQVAGTVDCRSPEAAARIKNIVQAVLTKAIEEFSELEDAGPGTPQAALAAGPSIPSITMKLINATSLQVNGAELRSLTTLASDFGSDFAKAIVPARAAARSAASTNKMKQIGIALQNYVDTHKQFPPAVVIGPDGKTPHSWRVEMLRFMGKQDLYDRYKMDEPWDSEHNKQLVKEGADLFSVPSDPPNDTCGYYLVVGPGTAFDPDQPPSKIRNIIDGTSQTIALVEAKRGYTWTQPEDVKVDPDQPLPKLGGYFDEGYGVGYLDGHVMFFPHDFDERILRILQQERPRADSHRRKNPAAFAGRVGASVKQCPDRTDA